MDWQEPMDGLLRGRGVRVFRAGTEDVCVLDWRSLQMTHPRVTSAPSRRSRISRQARPIDRADAGARAALEEAPFTWIP